MDSQSISGKKLLITNHHLINFAGSELTTYYIAAELKNSGWDVTIATFSYGFPIKNIFESKDIKVINVLENDLCERNFDLIWSHHSPVLNDCIFRKNVTAKQIIFSSLSPYEPLEVPPVYINMLPLCIANSHETMDKLICEGVDREKIIIFPNSIDESFFNNFIPNKECVLKNICVVSNHICPEIENLIVLLKESDINVDIYGIDHKFELVTPEVLINYDAVITIGRSVQYCLALGIPVYCYDRFGGPGWITQNNIADASYYNFSGRCVERKLKGTDLFVEIINHFRTAFSQRERLHTYARQNFSLKDNINYVLNELSDRKTYINKIKKAYSMNKRIVEFYERELAIELSKDEIIRQKQHEITDLTNQLKNIHDSKGWKLLKLYQRIKASILS